MSEKLKLAEKRGEVMSENKYMEEMKRELNKKEERVRCVKCGKLKPDCVVSSAGEYAFLPVCMDCMPGDEAKFLKALFAAMADKREVTE